MVGTHKRNIEGILPYRFQKGQVANPTGRTALPPELRNIKSFTHLEVTKIISKYGRMIVSDLFKMLKEDKEMPAMDRAIAGMFQKSIEQKDYTSLSFLLDRAVGKVPAMVEEEDDDSDAAKIRKLPLQELLQLVKLSIPEMKEDFTS